MDALPPDRVRELRRVIDGMLRQQQVYSQIRNVLAEFADGDPRGDALLDVVQERGIIDSLLDSLPRDDLSGGRPGAPPTPAAAQLQARRRAGRRFLHVRLLGGRAFIENLDADPARAQREQLTVCLSFGQQRFRSQAVDSVCDPPFEDDFLLDLDEEVARLGPQLARFGGERDGPDPTNRDLLRLDTKLHFVVVRHDPERGVTRYVGENAVDWRSVLRQGGVAQEVQVGPLSVPAGLLLLQLELVPAPAAAAAMPDEELQQQRSAEGTEQQAAAREFWAYARRWWQEYHQIDPGLEKRHVKVYTELLGPAMQKVPVVSLVSPVSCSRVLDSPLEAGRFVTLLGYDADDDRLKEGAAVIGGTSDAWATPFALLCRGKGHAAERAPLLCSLLLGFGLDAWVALGVDKHDQRAAWVLTRTFHPQSDSPPSVTFWDLTTGQRTHAAGPPDGLAPARRSGEPCPHSFREVHCCFSHQRFAACVARDCSCDGCSFDFSDERWWKEMSPIKLRLPRPQPIPPLLPPSLERLGAAEEGIESVLAAAIGRHRDALGLPSAWDQARAYCMAQHLWKCEMEKLTGQPMEDQTFASAVRNTIPPGSTFAAYPVHFAHRSPTRMLARMARDKRIQQVLELRGVDLRLTVRVKMFVYADDALSVWVMLAASSRQG
eukprot:TRINITY_DN64932_c0_g1_i1.p1 TRINITY_DN64932_c0_g1~~TRINITY_DN64932_c0_g1_i1.p1  ORF type:complete len:694 (+),score=214.44 TRINITY_DN64932_c0_g1_i1:101-2083(+)